MAFVKISGRAMLSRMFQGLDDSIRVTGATYDATEDVLVVNVAGKGLADYGEVVARDESFEEEQTFRMFGTRTVLTPK